MASCYYPNGSPSPGDIPCNTSGTGPCCPLNWSCESNGLCYLANAGYYGRYTCTDKSWNSPSCPQICTYDKTATGDEAILQCSSGSYCCDTNRPSPGCCDTTTNRFPLAALPIIAGGGSSIGSMGSAPSSSAANSPTPSSTPASSPPSSSTAPSSSAHPLSSTSTPNGSGGSTAAQGSSSPSISVFTSIITENGVSSTLVTSTTANAAVIASSTSSPSTSSSGSSKSLGSIIGPAVGVPVAVLALMALAFFLLWRRRRNRRAQSPPINFQSNADHLTPMYRETKPPEPTSPYAGKSELEGSPLVGHSPNPSTAPPSYRGVSGQQRPLSELQGSPTVPTFRDSRGSELAASPREPQLPAVGEDREGEQLPPELPGSTYRPYRPEGWQQP